MELKKYKLGEICEIYGRIGFRGYTTMDLAENENDGAITLSPSNIENGEISFSRNTYLKWNKFYESPEIILEKGDIVLVKTGSSIGKTALVRDIPHPITLNPQFVVLKKIQADSIYLSYVLKGEFFQKSLHAITVGSTIPTLSQENLSNISIFLPTIENQRRIAAILTSIDRKIALNRAINQDLEALAKQLYDYWFVQFDFPDGNGRPYKSSGGKMVWNEVLKRRIPEHWHCGNLFEIASFTNGIACQKFRPKQGETSLPVIKIKEMHDGITADTELVTSQIPELVKVYNGDVLFSWSASLEVILWAFGDGGLNQHLFKVTSANGFPKSFYYYQLLDYVEVFKKMAEARKTTMGHITQDHLQQSTIPIPDDVNVANRFESRISPIFKQIVMLQEEITSLTHQRDELLPLLMNGQVEVEN